ncbi:MAG: hypothetical protein GF347_04895 [Candidatus Moranbacteria bacterium]|nr:hypothetical protein [Candidatus Moranbacteria bacterium]
MAKKQTKKSEASEVADWGWVNIIKDWFLANAKDLTSNFVEEVQKKMENIFIKAGQSVSRTLFTSLTMFSGLIFMMIGLAILINDLIGISNSIGYIMIGFVVVLVGMFSNKNL